MTPSLDESYATIPLTQGQFALIDADLFSELNRLKWSAHWSSCTGSYYAVHTAKIPGTRKCTHISMHRMILGLTAKDGKIGDHINGYTLDNRRKNLRVVNHTQNAINQKIRKNNQSGLKGVYRHHKKWAAQINIAGKMTYLGIFETKESAHAAYLKAAEQHHGQYSRVSILEAAPASSSPCSPYMGWPR